MIKERKETGRIKASTWFDAEVQVLLFASVVLSFGGPALALAGLAYSVARLINAEKIYKFINDKWVQLKNSKGC